MEHETTYQRLHRTTATERSKIIERFRRSGLSRRNFARKHGFAISTFHRWMAKAGDQSRDSRPQQFSEVKLLPSFPLTSWAMEIVSASGVTVRLRDMPGTEDLARILSGAAC